MENLGDKNWFADPLGHLVEAAKKHRINCFSMTKNDIPPLINNDPGDEDDGPAATPA